MTNPWFAGLPPHAMLAFIQQQPHLWGSWLCLTDADAHKTLMLIEVEALRKEMVVQVYVSPVHIEGDGMDTDAWSIAARTTDGQWKGIE